MLTERRPPAPRKVACPAQCPVCGSDIRAHRRRGCGALLRWLYCAPRNWRRSNISPRAGRWISKVGRQTDRTTDRSVHDRGSGGPVRAGGRPLAGLERMVRSRPPTWSARCARRAPRHCHAFCMPSGIREVGETTAQALARQFGVWTRSARRRDALQQTPTSVRWWPTMWHYTFASRTTWRSSGRKLRKAGGLDRRPAPVAEDLPLAGRTFVLTGACRNRATGSRNGCRALGAKVAGSVSKKPTTWSPAKMPVRNSTRRGISVGVLDEDGLNRLIAGVISQVVFLTHPSGSWTHSAHDASTDVMQYGSRCGIR